MWAIGVAAKSLAAFPPGFDGFGIALNDNLGRGREEMSLEVLEGTPNQGLLFVATTSDFDSLGNA